MSKAIKIKTNKTTVKPAVVFGDNWCCDWDCYGQSGCMGQEIVRRIESAIGAVTEIVMDRVGAWDRKL